MRFPRAKIEWVFALLAAGGAGLAGAAPPSPLRAMTGAPARAGGSKSVVAGLGSSVDPAALAGMSGGTAVTESITISGSVADTTTTDVATGYNLIGGGAFSNAAGLPMVIQNTGNSVLIQNATVVNVQLQP